MGVRVTVEFEESTVAKLDALAADTNRPRDLLMRAAVEGFVAHEAALVAKIKERIAAADRGEFATEEELDQIEREIAGQHSYSLRSSRCSPNGTVPRTPRLMTAFERWDVVTALFPFTDIAVRRPRPVLVLSGAEFNQQHGLHDHQSVAKSLAERSCDPRSRSDRAPAHVRRSLEAVHVVSRRTGALATVDREPLAAKLAQIFID